MHRLLARYVACFVTTLLAVSGCSGDTTTDTPPGRSGTPVAVMALEPRDLSRLVTVSAPVEPRVHIRLASRSNGTVARLLREEGDRVVKGELLAELDMSEQRAELARAKAEQQRARADYERLAELRERQVASVAEYQQARATLQVAESERELWLTRVGFGRIVAPADSVIVLTHIEPGEAVQQYATLFELAAMDELVVRPGMPDVDVVHLAVGDQAAVHLEALPGEPLTGTIRRIFPAADATSRLVTVEVALPGGADRRGVRPGYLARLQFDVDPRHNVLALPTPAIGALDDGSGHYVFIVDHENRLQRRTIDIGISRDGWTEVAAGLEPGELVLASNPIDMRDDQQVRIVERRN